MHITQTEDSQKIRESGQINITNIDSPESDGLYSKLTLNLKDDPRLPKLVAAVKEEIKERNWTPDKNEQEICETTIRLMHDEKFYGPYDKRIADLQMNNPNDTKDLANLVDKNNHIKSLKDFKDGKLICMQEAAIASYTLDSVGIRNDYCEGPKLDDDGKIIGHAFVQTKTGNIVEATDPDNPYFETQNKKLIANGDIAIVKDDLGSFHTYGSGNMPGLDAIGYTLSYNKNELLKNQIQKNAITEAANYATKAPEFASELKQGVESSDVARDLMSRIASENKSTLAEFKSLNIKLSDSSEHHPHNSTPVNAFERQSSKSHER